MIDLVVYQVLNQKVPHHYAKNGTFVFCSVAKSNRTFCNEDRLYFGAVDMGINIIYYYTQLYSIVLYFLQNTSRGHVVNLGVLLQLNFTAYRGSSNTVIGRTLSTKVSSWVWKTGWVANTCHGILKFYH